MLDIVKNQKTMIELSTKKARSVAKEFLGNLGQFCDLITISGSIRRGEKHHSIIDLVCIPKLDKKRKTINSVRKSKNSYF